MSWTSSSSLLPPEAGDGLVDALKGGLGLAAAGRQGRCGAGFGDDGSLHATSCSGPGSSVVHVSLYSSCSSLPASARSAARKAADHTFEDPFYCLPVNCGSFFWL